MLNVVFTGPAHDSLGNPILRADLIAAAQAAGYMVLPSMQHGANLLVSSRVDTVKARTAAERHVPIIGYVEFLAQLGTPVTPAARSKYRPDAWVDAPSAGLVGDEL
jgi:hypothetical protein